MILTIYLYFCNNILFFFTGNPPLSDLCAGGPGVFDDDEDSDGWNEMDVSGEQTTCLFCPLQFHTIAVALDHCRTQHKFDLLALKNKYNMDCYSYIKMINYIRLHNPEPKILTDTSVALWDDEVYMKPGEMETWLMYGEYLNTYSIMFLFGELSTMVRKFI